MCCSSISMVTLQNIKVTQPPVLNVLLYILYLPNISIYNFETLIKKEKLAGFSLQLTRVRCAPSEPDYTLHCAEEGSEKCQDVPINSLPQGRLVARSKSLQSCFSNNGKTDFQGSLTLLICVLMLAVRDWLKRLNSFYHVSLAIVFKRHNIQTEKLLFR